MTVHMLADEYGSVACGEAHPEAVGVGPLVTCAACERADRDDLLGILRDQRNALCAIARAFGWPSEDWTVERLVAEAARLRALEAYLEALQAAFPGGRGTMHPDDAAKLDAMVGLPGAKP